MKVLSYHVLFIFQNEGGNLNSLLGHREKEWPALSCKEILFGTLDQSDHSCSPFSICLNFRKSVKLLVYNLEIILPLANLNSALTTLRTMQCSS